jgi:hypothetical protein
MSDQIFLIEIRKACRSRNSDRLLKLLRHRENFDLNQHIDGFYPVHWASGKSTQITSKKSDNIECISILNTFNADLNKRSVDHNKNNLLPIQLACYGDQLSIFTYLLITKSVKKYIVSNGGQSIFAKYIDKQRTPQIYKMIKETINTINTENTRQKKK